MLISSWNVNGLRAVERKGALEECINVLQPEVLLLQEIKGHTEKFSPELLDESVYKKFFNPAEKAGYSGVSIWVHTSIEKSIEGFSKGMKGWKDNEGRIARVDFNDGLTIISVYVPNGGKSEEAYKDKLKFFTLLAKNYSALVKEGRRVIIGGDFNVARSELDLAEPEKHLEHTHFNKEVREHIEKISKVGFVDTFRERNPTKKEAYSYWDNFDFSLPKGTTPRSINKGWRLDIMFADTALNAEITKASIHTDILGSDHCPVSVVL